MKISWHLSNRPIASSPLQFNTIYPMIVPMIPYKHVEAPALTIVSDGVVRQLNIFPPIPEIK